MTNLTSQWRVQEHRALKRVLEKVFAYLKLACEQPPKRNGAKQKIDERSEPSVAWCEKTQAPRPAPGHAFLPQFTLEPFWD